MVQSNNQKYKNLLLNDKVLHIKAPSLIFMFSFPLSFVDGLLILRYVCSLIFSFSQIKKIKSIRHYFVIRKTVNSFYFIMFYTAGYHICIKLKGQRLQFFFE